MSTDSNDLSEYDLQSLTLCYSEINIMSSEDFSTLECKLEKFE